MEEQDDLAMHSFEENSPGGNVIRNILISFNKCMQILHLDYLHTGNYIFKLIYKIKNTFSYFNSYFTKSSLFFKRASKVTGLRKRFKYLPALAY